MSRVSVRQRAARAATASAACASLALAAPMRAATVRPPVAPVDAVSSDIVGIVADSTTGQPIASAEIAVTRAGQLVANASTDAFGRFTIHDLTTATYRVMAHQIGFRPQTMTVVVDGGGRDVQVSFRLSATAVSLSAIEVKSQIPLAVNTRSGDQTFKQDDYHGAPTNTTSQILQQSIAGAARAPTGEVHIRGQHAEYTYYVDGVPVPAGISGSMNELFDPEVVNQIDF